MTPKQRRIFARKIHDFAAHTLGVPVPPGKTLKVTVSLEFVDKNPSTEVFLRESLSGKLVVCDEPFTSEHFKDVLELPLAPKARQLVQFYHRRKNQPYTMAEMEALGLSTANMSYVNKMCSGQGLWLAIKPVESFGITARKYKFFVLRQKVETTRVDNYVGPWG